MRHTKFCAAPDQDHPGYCKAEDPKATTLPVGTVELEPGVYLAPQKPTAWLTEVKRTLRDLAKYELRLRHDEDVILGRGMPAEYSTREREFSEMEVREILTRQPTVQQLETVALLRQQIWHTQLNVNRLRKEALKRGFTLAQLEEE